MTIKFYHQLLKKGDAQAIFLVTSGKQTSNNWHFVSKKLTLDLNTAMVEVMKGVEQPFIQEIPQ